jgi:hypothetical protein
MKIITDEGKLEEGIALTPDESDFVEKVTKGVKFGTEVGYISSRDRERIALFIVKNFNITRRVPAEHVDEEA